MAASPASTKRTTSVGRAVRGNIMGRWGLSCIWMGMWLVVLVITPVLATGSQEGAARVTKQEILEVLKAARANPRLSQQSDLAEKIADQGIAFELNATLLEEFRIAGARSFLLDAIQRAVVAKREISPAQRDGGGLRPIQPQATPTDTRLREQPESTPDNPTSEDGQDEREKALAALPFIEQARLHALEYTDDLPNFRVTQYVVRYRRGPGDKDWVKNDTLELDLTYSDRGGEKYRLVRLNGAPARIGYDQVTGSTSTGEFGALLYSLFALRAKTEFRETAPEKFNGRDSRVFDFLVRKVNSNSELTDRTSGRTVVAGYRGTVWIDAETKRVLRIELAHENIHPGFPITLAENSVEYDWVTIGGQRYLLPVRAEVLLGRDQVREYSRNVIEFRQYQKFDTEVKLIPENN